MYTAARELGASVGSEVSMRGWISAKRSSGRVVFLGLRDGSGVAQLVGESGVLPDEQFEALKSAPLEAPAVVEGLVVRPEGRPAAELSLRSLRLLPSEQDYPLGRKEHGPDFLQDNRHLWIRSPKQAAYMRIRSSLEFACEEFLRGEGFFRFDAPLITPNACEGTTQLFELGYFEGRAYLSQSGQLYSEAGIAALEKVYALGPCFRAESSRTRRHLTEFWGVEPEMAWVEAEENIAFQERFIRAVLAEVADERAEDLAFVGRDPADLVFDSRPFPVILYDEALAALARLGREIPWGEDLGVEDEEALSMGFDRPFFIYKYPVACRAFYIEPDPERPELALSSDCLMHGGFGEIITGGQRASDYAFLKSRIEASALSLEDFAWYLDLRRFGSVPHSGFGMGIERMLRWICGIHHIREAIPFARTPSRCRP